MNRSNVLFALAGLLAAAPSALAQYIPAPIPGPYHIGPDTTYTAINLSGSLIPPGLYTRISLTAAWNRDAVPGATPILPANQRLNLSYFDSTGSATVGAQFFNDGGGVPPTSSGSGAIGTLVWNKVPLDTPVNANGSLPLFLELRNAVAATSGANWTNLQLTLHRPPAEHALFYSPSIYLVGPETTYHGINLNGPGLPAGTYTRMKVSASWSSQTNNGSAGDPIWQSDQRIALHNADATGAAALTPAYAGPFEPTTATNSPASGIISWMNQSLTTPFVANGVNPCWLNIRNSYPGDGGAIWGNLTVTLMPTDTLPAPIPGPLHVGPNLNFVGVNLHGPLFPPATYSRVTVSALWTSDAQNNAANLNNAIWQSDQRIALHTADATGLPSITGGARYLGDSFGIDPSTAQNNRDTGTIRWDNYLLTTPFVADADATCWLNLRNGYFNAVAGGANWTNIVVTFFIARCQPADIADDAGNPLPSSGPNNGVNEGDYNAFFNTFFTNQAVGSPADIADDAGNPLPPFGPAGTPNAGVNEGDYNAFFNNFFNGCPA
ncbi:hypothetical protein BH11PLA1_BH11PLA1_24240 [soil metagenome]